MAWSYDPTDLGKHLNWIRLMVGDVEATDPLISDEEITGLLALEQDRGAAAMKICAALAAKFAARGGKAEVEAYQLRAQEISKYTSGGYL